MKVVSVNVGLPREVDFDGKAIATGIFKQPVIGRVAVRTLNLDGDRQADLSVHGGPDKAVYVYPAEHYGFWHAELPAMELPWAQFGENLTVEGLMETEVSIGDRFRVGPAELIVTQLRVPCYKLGIRFGRPDMVRHFLKSGRTGFYCGVLREGDVEAGDPSRPSRARSTGRGPGRGGGGRLTPLTRAEHSLKLAEITRLYAREERDSDLLRRAAELTLLPPRWCERFHHLLQSEETP